MVWKSTSDLVYKLHKPPHPRDINKSNFCIKCAGCFKHTDWSFTSKSFGSDLGRLTSNRLNHVYYLSLNITPYLNYSFSIGFKCKHYINSYNSHSCIQISSKPWIKSTLESKDNIRQKPQQNTNSWTIKSKLCISIQWDGRICSEKSHRNTRSWKTVRGRSNVYMISKLIFPLIDWTNKDILLVYGYYRFLHIVLQLLRDLLLPVLYDLTESCRCFNSSLQPYGNICSTVMQMLWKDLNQAT